MHYSADCGFIFLKDSSQPADIPQGRVTATQIIHQKYSLTNQFPNSKRISKIPISWINYTEGLAGHRVYNECHQFKSYLNPLPYYNDCFQAIPSNAQDQFQYIEYKKGWLVFLLGLGVNLIEHRHPLEFNVKEGNMNNGL